MGPLLAGLLIGGATGLLKHGMDSEAADRQRKLQGEIARYSPWTGMQAQAVKEPSLVGNALQGAGAGAMIGQSYAAGAPGATGTETTNPANYNVMGGAAPGAPQYGLIDPAMGFPYKLPGASAGALQGTGMAGVNPYMAMFNSMNQPQY